MRTSSCETVEERGDKNDEPGEGRQDDETKNDHALLAPFARRRCRTWLEASGWTQDLAMRARDDKTVGRRSVSRGCMRWLASEGDGRGGPTFASRGDQRGRRAWLPARAGDPDEGGSKGRRQGDKRWRVGVNPTGE